MNPAQSQTGTWTTPAPMPPEALDGRAGEDRRRLGEALKERVEAVLELTAP